MKKFIVLIEETCIDAFEISAANAEEALSIAKNDYNCGKIVLNPDECQFKQMKIISPDDEATDWREF